MSNSPDTFVLDKFTWTEADFKVMGWHDANIYALKFEKEENSWTGDLMLDIDYIFKWVHSDPPGGLFKFWVAPCTLIFKEAFKLEINLDTENYSIEGIEISDLTLTNTTKHEGNHVTYHWTIELRQGQIKLASAGYIQIVRQKPLLVEGQTLSKQQRGDSSFSRTPYLC